MALSVHMSPTAHEQGAPLLGEGLIAGAQSNDGSTIHILALLQRPPCPNDVSPICWTHMLGTSVTRMLSGGIDLLGAYTDDTTPEGLAKCYVFAGTVARSLHLVLTSDTGGRLVVHTGAANAKPVDVCTARTVPVRLEATLSLRELPTARIRDMKPLSLLVAKRTCLARAQELVASAALVIPKRSMGRREDHEVLIRDALNWGNPAGGEGKPGKGGGENTTSVLKGELVFPLHSIDADDDSVPVVNPPCAEPGLSVVLSGALALRAVVQPDCTIGDAEAALRADAIRSLGARASTLADVCRDMMMNGDGSEWPAGAGERGIPVRFAVRRKGAHSGELLEYAEYALCAENTEGDVLGHAKRLLDWTDAEAEDHDSVLLEATAPTIVEAHRRPQVHANSASGFKKEIRMNSTWHSMGIDTFRAWYFGVVALIFVVVAGLLFRALL